MSKEQFYDPQQIFSEKDIHFEDIPVFAYKKTVREVFDSGRFTKDDLQIKSGNNTHIVTDDNEKALKLINASGIAEGKMDSDGRIIIEGALDRDRDVVKFLVGKDIFVKEVVNEEFSLEDYFLRVTGGGQANG